MNSKIGTDDVPANQDVVSPAVMDASIKRTMQLIGEVYDNSSALSRHNTLTRDLVEARKLDISADQRKTLVDTEDLRHRLNRIRSKNMRFNIVIQMIAVVSIVLGTYFCVVVLMPQLTVDHPVIDKIMFLVVFATVSAVFIAYARKYINVRT